jgi:hypothetical protein
LKNRGFDGFEPEDLDRYINWSYFEIARKGRWFWEDSYIDATFQPGDVYFASSAVPNFRELKEVYSIQPDREGKLLRLSEGEFKQNWLPLDLTTPQFRAQPDSYYFLHDQLYLIPPPEVAITVRVFYYARVVPLVAEGDTPITPADMDEAIILGALKRTHTRANEPTQAALRDADLQAVVADMHTDEVMRDEEYQERVEPDDTWL